MSPNSSSNLPQSFFDTTEAPSSTKVEDATNAKNDKDETQENGVLAEQPASNTAAPKPDVSCEDPYGLPTAHKKEEESSDSEEDPEVLSRDQPSNPFQEACEYAPYATENAQPHVAKIIP